MLVALILIDRYDHCQEAKLQLECCATCSKEKEPEGSSLPSSLSCPKGILIMLFQRTGSRGRLSLQREATFAGAQDCDWPPVTLSALLPVEKPSFRLSGTGVRSASLSPPLPSKADMLTLGKAASGSVACKVVCTTPLLSLPCGACSALFEWPCRECLLTCLGEAGEAKFEPE